MKRTAILQHLKSSNFIAIKQHMIQISNSLAAFKYLKPYFNRNCEEIWLITLNTQMIVINLHLISRGTLNYCLAHPRDIFRPVLKDNSYTLIIAHNHPSSDPMPTQQDILMTQKLLRISKLIEVNLIDHIVFTENDYFSFNENSLI